MSRTRTKMTTKSVSINVATEPVGFGKLGFQVECSNEDGQAIAAFDCPVEVDAVVEALANYSEMFIAQTGGAVPKALHDTLRRIVATGEPTALEQFTGQA